MAVNKEENMIGGGERGYPKGDNVGNEDYEKLRLQYFDRFERMHRKGCVWSLNMPEDYYLRMFKAWRV